MSAPAHSTASWRLALLLVVLPAAALADTPTAAPADFADWPCKFCSLDYGWSGALDAGLQFVDSSDYRYGEYSGLKDDGFYATLGGALAYRNAKGGYLEAQASDLGLASRRIRLEGGQRGLYKLYGGYQGIPQFRFDTASTPFLGSGSTLSLPGNWVYGADTAQMSALQSDLHRVDIQTRRKIAELGAVFTPRGSPWDYRFDLRQDRVDGTAITGANFLTSSLQLPLDQDQLTDQIEASVGRSGRLWQLRLGFYGSYFHQDADPLQWDNPYQAYNGASQGRMSQAPDNAFNQLSLTGGWQLLPSMRLMTNLAYGRAVQNEHYMPATINDSLGADALPRGDLDGRVNTVNDIVRLTARPLSKLSLTAEYLLNSRQNHSSVASYQQVVSDSYLNASRSNLPYSYRQQTARLSASYRLLSNLQLQAGGEQEQYARDYQQAARTRTTTVWGSARTTLFNALDLDLKYSDASRSITRRRELSASWLLPEENPLLQRFNLADRDRRILTASASYSPLPGLDLGADFEWHDDDYKHSQIGLTHAKDVSGTFNAGWTPSAKARLNGYLTLERIESDQAGSQSYSIPDWRGDNEDHVRTVGLDGEWRELGGKFDGKVDVGFAYCYSRTREKIAVVTGTPVTGFPANKSRFQNFQLYSRYRFNPQLSARLRYAWTELRTLDWALDDVEADTVPNFLSLGIDSPNYQVNLLGLSLHYEF